MIELIEKHSCSDLVWSGWKFVSDLYPIIPTSTRVISVRNPIWSAEDLAEVKLVELLSCKARI